MATMAASAVKQVNLESSILFMQQEHAATLKGLHEEIQKLQKRCSELTFQLAMQSTSTNEDTSKAEKLEKELNENRKKQEALEELIENRDQKIIVLEKQVKTHERKYQDDIKLYKQKIHSLSTDLDAKSDEIVNLREQLRQLIINQNLLEQRNQIDRYTPTPPREGTSTPALSRSRRYKEAIVDGNGQIIARKLPSSNIRNRPASGRRLPATPQDAQNVPDPAPFLYTRSTEEGGTLVEFKTSPAVLPPINSTDQANHILNHAFVKRQIALRKHKENGSPTRRSPEVESLAVDQISRKGSEWRQPQESSTSTDYF